MGKGIIIIISSGFNWLYYFKNSNIGFWCNNLLLLLVLFKKLIKLKSINKIKDVNKNAKKTFFYYFLRKCFLFYLVKINKKVGGENLLINLLVYLNPHFYMLFYFYF